MKLPLSRPDISEIEKKAVMKVLDTPYLSLGPKIHEFEKKVADYTGVKNAVAMSSGTAVLHVIVISLGLEKGDYVLTTPFSFISTSNCLLFEKVSPIFVDIDSDTYNLNPEDCENVYLNLPLKIRKRVKAIFYVDVFGVPADGIGFEKLGRKYGLKIVEDSAEAIGSEYMGRKCGSFGDAGLFAFYPNKQITTGEGGILLSNNNEIARLAKSLRNQGRDENGGWLQHVRLGFNYRISDINCALGIAQMERINEIIEKRKKVKEIYDKYFSKLFENNQLIPQKHLQESFISPFVYVLRLAERFSKITRDDLLRFLTARGIQCSNYFTPIHIHPFYLDLGWKYGDLPITEKISERTIALPFFNSLLSSEIEYVVEMVSEFFKNL